MALRCGLEIHQQLDTGKLFCRCPTTLQEGEPDFILERTLRAIAGETGDVDQAARHESAKRKHFRYHAYRDSTCLVELDEEPPHPLNEQALLAALQVAKLLGSTILDKVAVMRKTVIDGSNTTGFQRTALVALGGDVQDVRIQTICLEEDAAKIVERAEEADTYNLSRLGVPLIEIATEPDITSPEQAQRIAAELGMLLRSTGACKRGLGTIRQDLNVSIPGGARVEIKGAQDLKLIPTLIENEMKRQHALLELKKRLKEVEIPLAPPTRLTEAFMGTKCGLIKKGLAKGYEVYGAKLPGFAGLLATELVEGHRLGTELAGYAQSMGFGGLIHSDEEAKKYRFEKEPETVRKRLKVTKKDAYLLVLGSPEQVQDLFAFTLIPRLEQLRRGVPSEVRRANPEGTTTFLRPMPGAARMYPETDIPTVTPPARFEVPKPLAEQQAALEQHGLSAEQAQQLLRQGWDLEGYRQAFPDIPVKTLARTMLETPKELRKRYGKALDLPAHEEELREILERVNEGAIPASAIIELLASVADGKQPDYARFEAADEATIRAAVKEAVAADPKAPPKALMGVIMGKLRGKADGRTVMRILEEES